MEKRHWFIVVSIVLGVLWLQAEVDRWRLRREIGRVYLGDVTIQAIDADTKSPITVSIDGPPSTVGQQWPKSFTMSTTGDVSKMEARWVGVGDVEVGVSAKGYERVRVTLNAGTPPILVVPLRRSGQPDEQSHR